MVIVYELEQQTNSRFTDPSIISDVVSKLDRVKEKLIVKDLTIKMHYQRSYWKRSYFKNLL